MRSRLFLVPCAAAMLAATAGGSLASTFSAGNLVVMRVSNQNSTGSGSVILDEYSRTGAAVGNSIALPTSGIDAISLPNITNHDRHLHLSPNGQYLTFAAYGAGPSSVDPSTQPAASVARVVGIVDQSGSVDLSTRLTAAYNNIGIRSAVTSDGSSIWVSGDNAGGVGADSLTGGLRYTTRGSSITSNVSQVQATGGSQAPDNVRDANIFGGQLFDSSGSSASIGKGAFQVGTGLPTSGVQTLSALNTDGLSISSFVLLDLDPSIAGVDTMYAAATGLTKYVKQSNGSWLIKGTASLSGIDQVIAQANADGSVSVFAASASTLVSYTDAAPLTSTIAGPLTTILSAPSGYTLGGIEFTPVPAPGAAGLLALAGVAGARRRRR